MRSLLATIAFAILLAGCGSSTPTTSTTTAGRPSTTSSSSTTTVLLTPSTNAPHNFTTGAQIAAVIPCTVAQHDPKSSSSPFDMTFCTLANGDSIQLPVFVDTTAQQTWIGLAHQIMPGTIPCVQGSLWAMCVRNGGKDPTGDVATVIAATGGTHA